MPSWKRFFWVISNAKLKKVFWFWWKNFDMVYSIFSYFLSRLNLIYFIYTIFQENQEQNKYKNKWWWWWWITFIWPNGSREFYFQKGPTSGRLISVTSLGTKKGIEVTEIWLTLKSASVIVVFSGVV